MSIAMVSRPSFSSRQLARRLGIRRVVVGARATPRVTHLINWGCSDMPPSPNRGVRVINRTQAVGEAVDKKITFHRLKEAGVPTVEFTDKQQVAQDWLAKGSTVYGRQKTRSSGGDGIELYVAKEFRGKVAPAPLYTRFWKCDREIRVHVIGDEVVDFTQKRRVRDFEGDARSRYWIRTYGNGWVYTREGVRLRDSDKAIAIKAVRVLGLDFGAVDMRLRDGANGAAVLEVNSAPGLAGSTLDAYERGFRKLLRVYQ